MSWNFRRIESSAFVRIQTSAVRALEEVFIDRSPVRSSFSQRLVWSKRSREAQCTHSIDVNTRSFQQIRPMIRPGQRRGLHPARKRSHQMSTIAVRCEVLSNPLSQLSKQVDFVRNFKRIRTKPDPRTNQASAGQGTPGSTKFRLESTRSGLIQTGKLWNTVGHSDECYR